jgi:hypothetical protein
MLPSAHSPRRWLGCLALFALLALVLPDAPAPAQKDKADEKPVRLKDRDLLLTALAGGSYVSLSPGELLDHPLFKQAPPRLRESVADLEREMPARFGVRLRQLARVTIALPVGGMQRPVVLLASNKEHDLEALGRTLGDEWKKGGQLLAERPVFRNARVADLVMFYNPTLALYGRGEDLQAFLEHGEKVRTDPTLHDGLAALENGSALVIGLRPDDLVGAWFGARSGRAATPEPKSASPIERDKDVQKKDAQKKDAGREKEDPPAPPGLQPVAFQHDEHHHGPSLAEMLKELPPEALPYKPLFQCKSATVAVKLGEEEAQVSLRLSYAKPEQAEDGVVAVKTLLYVLREALPRWWVAEIGLKKETAVEVVRAVDRLVASLRKTTVQVAGKNVEATLSLPLEPALVGLLLREMDLTLPVAVERSNNLKQIGLAIHNYASTYDSRLPGSAFYSAQGKPLLSWRVAILPYIEQGPLYKQFKLDEPWDSPNNIKLLEKMPKLFAPPPGVQAEAGHTFLQGFSGTGAIFDPMTDLKQPGLCGGSRIQTIPDGTSNTAMVGESGKAVPWTKPDDIPAMGPVVPPLGYPGSDRLLILMCDGAVTTITNKPPLEGFRAIVGRADGIPFDIDTLKPGRNRP